MHRHLDLAVLLLTALLAQPVRAAESAPASSRGTAHDPATPPIDCPLHKQGVSTGTLRPFAESEKYIEFLERPDRAAWQKPDAVVAALHLTGSETLVDVGAGSGYFSFRLAKALPKGKVIATDVDPEMIRHIHHKVLTEGITNLKVVLTDPKDPGVGPGADVVFVCDVLHHVEGREAWLMKLSSGMKPGARLVLIEFKEGKLPEGPPEEVKIPKAQLVSMVEGAGLSLQADLPALLPYQTFLTFKKSRAGESARK
jgi:2-polyprenyl-3-methyl-5-hydroxy-6-metoxy-1,4-benzoquinol methylase